MAASKETKSPSLKFEYCECGCHGICADFGALSVGIYWDLKNSYKLVSGHGLTCGRLIKDCSSMEQAKRIANRMAVEELNKLADVLGYELKRKNADK